jgi:hypothetical protein
MHQMCDYILIAAETNGFRQEMIKRWFVTNLNTHILPKQEEPPIFGNILLLKYALPKICRQIEMRMAE